MNSLLTRLSAKIGQLVRFGYDPENPEDWEEVAKVTSDDGVEWIHVGRLIDKTKNRKIEKIPLSEIIGSNKDGGFSQSPREGFSRKRLAATDTRHPLIVDKNNVLLNGRHRAIKLKNAGKKHAKIVRATERDIDASMLSSREPIIRFAPGDIARRYLPDDPLVTEGQLLKAAAAKKKPIKPKKGRPRTFKPEVKFLPGKEEVAAKRAREVIEKMRSGSASPEEKAFLKERITKRAAGTRDPKKWLEASRGEGLNQDFVVNAKGKIQPTHPDEPRQINAQLSQGKKKKIGSLGVAYNAPLEVDPAAKRGRTGLLLTKSEAKIAKTNKFRVSQVTGRLRAEAQTFRNSVATKLTERRGLVQDIRAASHPLGVQPKKIMSGESLEPSTSNVEIGKKGVVSKPLERPPIKLLGRQQSLPKDLAAVDTFVKAETENAIKRRQDARIGVIRHIKSRVMEGRFPGVSPGPHQHAEVKTIVEKLETGAEMRPDEKQTLARDLTASKPDKAKPITPATVTKIQRRLTGLKESTSSEQGIKRIRRQAVKAAIPIIDSRTAEQAATKGYPGLRKVGRAIGVAGLIGAGALAAKGLYERRKEKRMSAKGGAILFGKLDPLLKLRVGKGTQSLGVAKEGSLFGNSVIDRLHRARLAAKRGDLEAFKEAGSAAGLFHPKIKPSKLYRRMQHHRAWDEAQEVLKKARSVKDVSEPYKRRVKRELEGKLGAKLDEARKSYESQTAKVTKQAEESIAHNRERTRSVIKQARQTERDYWGALGEESARADEQYAAGRKIGDRIAIAGGAAGLGSGILIGRKTKKKETQLSSRIRRINFERRKLDPAVTAGLSAAASGAILGSIPMFRRGTSARTAIKSIATGAAAGAALVGGGTLLGGKILGKPLPGEGAAITKRAALGGAITGAAAGVAAGVLGHKTRRGRIILRGLARTWKPANWARKSGVLGASVIGGLSGGVIASAHAADEGQQVDTLQSINRKPRRYAMSARLTSIQFRAQYPNEQWNNQGLTGRVAADRFKKKIEDADKQTRDSNALRAAGAGALAGLIARGKLPRMRRAAIGASIGAAASLAVRAGTKASKDIYGERSHDAKAINKLPQYAILGAAGVLGYRRLRGVRLSDKGGVIRFERDWTDKWTTNINVDRRSEDIYRWGSRAKRAVRDIKRLKKGEKNIDERGREQTPEWKKPWARRALVIGGIAGVIGIAAKGRGIIKGASEAATVAGVNATPAQKLAQYVVHGNAYRATKSAVGRSLSKIVPKGTGSTIKQAGGELKGIVRKMTNAPIEKINKKIVSEVGDITTRSVLYDEAGNVVKTNIINPAARAEKAAALRPHLAKAQAERDKIAAQIKRHEKPMEERRRRLNEILNPSTRLMSSKIAVTRFAAYEPNWRTTDERGNSARIFAPGHQSRVRRPKEWHERKSNRDLIAAAAIGVTSAGGLILGKRWGIGKGIARAEAAAVEKATAKATEQANERIRRHFANKFRGPIGDIMASSKDQLTYLSAALDDILSS